MRDRPWLTLLVCVLLFTAGAVAAGTAAGQARAGAVGGRITDAVTGAPLRSAYVHVYTPDGQYHGSWYADAQGEWMISLSEGAWKLRFSAGFHLDEYWNDKPDLASAGELMVPVAPLLDVDASLARSPQAHLKGTVVDGETGDPVAGVQVTACDPVLWNGGPYVYTAADGTYDLAVQPGTWGLCFDRHGYARVYYEHQPASAGATTFTVADGDEVTGVDEVLPRSAVVVYCSARDVDDALVPGIEVSLLDATDGHTVRTATTGADGTCVLDLGDLLGGRFKLLQHDRRRRVRRPVLQLRQRRRDLVRGGRDDHAGARLLVRVLVPALRQAHGRDPRADAGRRRPARGRRLRVGLRRRRDGQRRRRRLLPARDSASPPRAASPSPSTRPTRSVRTCPRTTTPWRTGATPSASRSRPARRSPWTRVSTSPPTSPAP